MQLVNKVGDSAWHSISEAVMYANYALHVAATFQSF
jgi:hypothetical protein